LKKLLAVLFLVGSQILTSNVHAQAKKFEGFAAAVGANLNYNNTTFYGGANNNKTLGGQSLLPTLDFSYNKAVSEKFLIGAGLTYDIGSAKVDNWTVVDGGVTYTATSKISNHYSAYIKPTFAATDRIALFGKVGYHFGTMNFTDTNGQMYSWQNPPGTATPYVNINKNVSGVGYGLGLTVMVTDKVFVSGEFSVVDFGKVTLGQPLTDVTATAQTKLNQGILSIGYKF
jgi:opacity protein-like surface antigen